MLPEELTETLSAGYPIGFAVGIALLLMAEALAPLVPVEPGRERAQHVLRNAGLWISSLVLADLLVGAWLLRIPERLYETPSGSLFGWSLPFVAWLVLGVVIIDFGQFVFHRFTHLYRPLWLVHAVHHSDERLDVSTALRFHPVEVALGLVWKVGFMASCGLPLWLLGVRGVLLAPIVMLQHANLRFPTRLDRALRWVFVTPGLHKLHHSPLESENNSNFGEIFSFWDRIFGTLRDTSRPKPEAYGLSHIRGEEWQSVAAMLATPITARRVQNL